MTDLSSSLATIEKALERLGRRVLLESLQGGVPAEAVRSSLSTVDLPSSPELETLYGWKNGTSTASVAAVDDIHLFPGFYLLSLEDALANYRAFANDARWTVGWLPLFANGGGDFYVLDLSQAATGPVRHFRIEESEHPIEFGSLDALTETLAAAFNRGIFFVDPSGYLEMDDLVFAGVAAELNPDIAWWRD
ncbi:SMI1/KNR4 family protein [Xylanimonas oleitrophica]|nr:SMI1/KNR4 family protein [Xylanimonas oleitrophica]